MFVKVTPEYIDGLYNTERLQVYVNVYNIIQIWHESSGYVLLSHETNNHGHQLTINEEDFHAILHGESKLQRLFKEHPLIDKQKENNK